MKSKNRIWNKTALWAMAAFVFVAALPWFQSNGYAAVPKLDQIRVALFLDNPKVNTPISVVSVSSPQGLDVGLRTPSAVQSWFSAAGNGLVRFSLDQYALLLLETGDFSQAKAMADKFPASGGQQAYIIGRTKQGKASYQVYWGNFADMNAAAAAREKLGKEAVPAIAGPYHWNIGSFAAEADALQLQGAAAQAGLNADVVLQRDASGRLNYAVWLGSEASQEQLNGLKQRASALLPGVSFQPVTQDAPYFLRRNDVTFSSNGADAAAHYVFNPAGQKTWIQTKTPGIFVKEKSGRTYRGNLELSLQGGSLAVINELPFEQYLYSVVSSEMGTGWPAEALKAQAVAARTYALKQGLKYQIAHVTDSTLDQAYKGMTAEAADAVAAVDATNGEVLADANGLITPYYSSNAGGLTADPAEVWDNPVTYLKSTPSPDEGAAAGKAVWYRVSLDDGTIGYVHSAYLKNTGAKNAIGLSIYSATDNAVNVRLSPSTDASSLPIGKLNTGDRVTVLGQIQESNAYSWMRGPYDAAALQSKLAGSGVVLTGPLQTLEVSQRGASGRATEVKANGQPIRTSTPDALRTALGGLPSTRFEIEETGRYTIVGANGATRQLPDAGGPLYVLSGQLTAPVPVTAQQMVVINGDNQIRVISKAPQFIFTGKGFGHGLGMSQWGAKGYAELGYDYKKILQTYYSGVSIVKGD